MSFINTLVRSFTKPHTSSEGGSGTTIYVGGGNTNYDNNNLNVVNVNANTASINNLNAKNIKVDNIKSDYIDSRAANIGTVYGDTLAYNTGNIDDLTSSDIKTSKLNVTDTATINNLIAEYIQSKDIVTDNLTVNKTAHFFELIIDKINSVGGTIINTAANCSLDYVEAYDQNDHPTDIDDTAARYYRCYWKNTNAEGKAVDNKWKPYDQAICQSFNVSTGVNHNVSNKYYWRLVNCTDLSNPFNLSTRFINLNEEYDFDNKVLDAATDYVLEFSNGFIFTDGTTTVNLTAEAYEGSDFDDENNVLTVHAVGDAIKIYGYDTNDDSDIILSAGDIVFDTDIHAKMSLIAVYDDGTVDYSSEDTYETYHSFTIPADKNVSYLLARVDTVEVWDECNWIDLSNTDKDGSSAAAQDPNNASIPGLGDDVCQLGYRYDMLQNPTQDDISRASAIIIAAYKTPDAGIVPPSYAQYQGIGHESNYRWNLGHYRGSYFDAERAKFIGEFEVQASGSTIPLEDYIKSFNTANPLEGYIYTNNNQPVDLVVLQTDNSDKIYDLNNFPNNLEVIVTYEGSPQFEISDYDSLTLTLFDVPYDLLEANNYTPNLPSGYQGIYVSSITKSQYQPFRLQLAFTGNEQTITTSAMTLHAEVTDGSDTYTLNKSISINSVSSVEGTDAEVYQLYADTETALVKKNRSLDITLRYAVEHIVGTTSTIIQPTQALGLKLRISRYRLNGSIDAVPQNDQYRPADSGQSILLYSSYTTTGGKTGQGYWEYTYNPNAATGSDKYNWYADSNHPIYVVAELLDSSNNILANTLVYIILEPSSMFSVTDGLTQSIQANTTAITDAEGNITTLQNNYTNINQTVNSISSTVVSQQAQIGNINTNINTINGDITDINGDISTINGNITTMQSTITQMPNEIKAEVITDIDGQLQSTGIDIEQGTITLNAENTNINGNLNIYNPNEGLAIYDENDPKIFLNNASIGTFQEFDRGNIIAYPLSFMMVKNPSSQTFTVNYCNEYLGQPLNIGNREANSYINISDIYVQCNENTQPFESVIQSASYNVLLNNVSIASGTPEYITSDNKIIQIKIPQISYLNETAGSKTLEISITWTITKLTEISTYMKGTCDANVDIMQTIGTDGAIFKSGIYKHAIFATDSIDLRNLGNDIRITETGILRSQSNSSRPGSISGLMGDISSTVPFRTINSNYVTTPFDCILNVTVNTAVVTLGETSAATPYGKMIIILNDSTGTITINAGGWPIIYNGSEIQSINLTRYHTLTFVYVSSVWWVISHL